MMPEQDQEHRQASLFLALLPVVLLIICLAMSVWFFAEEAAYGANQIALLLAAAVAAAIAMGRGQHWADIEQAIINGIANAMIAILILLVIGALIGSWMLSGTVQSMIYYGLLLISPQWFYAAACLVSAIAALSIGSSWTVAGTLGVAFMGMAGAMQMNPAIAAGAIISGAYFGDKLSPLSDTANLTAAVTATPLFTHIQAAIWTSAPAFVLSLAAFAFIGGSASSEQLESVASIRAGLQQHFAIGLHLLLPMLLLAVMAWRRVPALITITAGTLLAALIAVIFQQDSIARFVEGDVSAMARSIIAVWVALFDGFSSNTGNDVVDELLSRGGMSSMLYTVWLIICALTFGAVMEQAGLLQRIMSVLLHSVRGSVGLVVMTVFTAIGANVITAEQYISIILPGRMFRLEYAKHGLASENLSRTLADSAVGTSALVPWNTCGAYMAATLGVATWSYLPYAFFNLLGPVLCIGFVMAHFRVVPLKEESQN